MIHIKRQELAELICTAVKNKYLNRAVPGNPDRTVTDVIVDLDKFEYSINHNGTELDTLDITLITEDRTGWNVGQDSLIII